jgi:hypothetical protein
MADFIEAPDGMRAPAAVEMQAPLQASGMGELADRFQVSDEFFMKQKLRLNKRGCCCYDLDNIYYVYKGNKEEYDSHVHMEPLPTYNGPQHILQAREKTGYWTRACCAPYHSFMVEISFPDKPDQVAYTIQRPGRKACCPAGFWCGEMGSAKPCIGYGACMPCCADEMTVHKGDIKAGEDCMDEPSGIKEGKADPIYQARQPPGCQVMFEPGVDVFKGDGSDGSEPVVKIRGPMCFGGCSELCCDNHFYAKNDKDVQIGEVKKLHPEGCVDLCKEICTEADNYSLDMKGSAPDERAAIFVGALLTDYMFFEMDHGLCHYDQHNRTCYINLCYCYCMGCLIPCSIAISGGEGE